MKITILPAEAAALPFSVRTLETVTCCPTVNGCGENCGALSDAGCFTTVAATLAAAGAESPETPANLAVEVNDPGLIGVNVIDATPEAFVIAVPTAVPVGNSKLTAPPTIGFPVEVVVTVADRVVGFPAMAETGAIVTVLGGKLLTETDSVAEVAASIAVVPAYDATTV